MATVVLSELEVNSINPEQERFFRLVDIATNVLSFGVRVAVERGFFGRPKPTPLQTGYCYGFAEEMADVQLGIDDFERAAFVQLVFKNLFGRAGDGLVSDLIREQGRYRDGLERGNREYREWNDGKRKAPLVPRA
jgi:hypothetical protein